MNKSKSAKQKVFLTLIIILALMYVTITPIVSYIDYKYELDKCSNLKTSTYEFTHDIQVNVEYAQNCYYYNHNPLALLLNIGAGYLIGALILAIPAFILFLIYLEKYDDWGVREENEERYY